MGQVQEDPKPRHRQSLLLDFGPLVVFFVAYKLRGIYWATGAFMVAVTAALIASWLRTRKLPLMPLVTAVIVLVFGGMTIWLGDPRFIYVKPTIITTLTAVALLGGLAFKRPLLKPLMGSALQMKDEGWRALSFRFALFSLCVAGLNEVVWRSFTPHAEDMWVWFKFLGIPLLTVAFLFSQAPLLKRFGIERESVAGDAE